VLRLTLVAKEECWVRGDDDRDRFLDKPQQGIGRRPGVLLDKSRGSARSTRRVDWEEEEGGAFRPATPSTRIQAEEPSWSECPLRRSTEYPRRSLSRLFQSGALLSWKV